ncbi:MAG TPA: putative Ig domain-containing protein [Blastocatellia bacterium]|nr:putative Ig domain-containing protein [Blastocatellia bacterium]
MIRKISLTCLALLLALASSARTERRAAADFTDDDDLIVGARAIVIGQVHSLACRLDADQDRVFTYVTIDVEETLKGTINEHRIVLKEEGGEVAGQGSIIYGTPQFARGERVLLYLDTWRDGSLRVHQMSFGKLTVAEDAASGEAILIRSDPGCEAMIAPAAQRPHSHATTADHLRLADYRRVIRSRLAANRERAEAFEAANYASVPCLAEPREYAGAVSRGEMRPQFTLLYPVKSVRWFEPDTNQPVTFYINPDQAPNPQVIADVGAAMTAWSNIAGCRLRLVNGGASNVCPVQRNLNAFTFNNCDNRFSPSPTQGRIIALGGLKWTSDETKQVNGQTFVRAAYGFVSLNPYATDSYDDHCSLREVATHEFGHALGLGHSQYPDATMFGTAHFDGRCASITDDDANGLTFLYPINDPGPRPLVIETATLLPDAVDQIRYLQAIVSSGGILPHNWSIVPGYGRPPSGLALNTGGILSGVPLETGTFNFKAQVDDGAGNIQQKTFTITVRPALPFDSRYISQSVISTVQAGQTFSATLKWYNVGSQMWDASTVRLAAQNPPGNAIWGVGAIGVPGFTLKSDTLVIQFTVTAPRAAGTYIFQWQLYQEGRGFFGQPSPSVQIVVTAGPPSIDSSGPLQATASLPFSYQLTVVGGTPPFNWSLASGALPVGLSLNPQSGIISGTPAAAGSATFTAQVTDAISRTAQRTLSISIAPAPPAPLRLDLTTSFEVAKGQTFSYQPTASGGTPPYSWAITAGALPPGLTLNTATGAVSGTPTASGDYSITLAVRDQLNQVVAGTMAIKVTEAQPAPLISKAKYKAGSRKLIVTGERFDAAATLMIDGSQVAARFDAGTLIAKPVTLTAGTHEVKVINPGGIASPPYNLTVE